MPRKDSRNTKMKIVNAAWELFYRNGFDNTTIEDIVDESGTSRGSFYHYFNGKEELLSSLSSLFDSRYEELQEKLTDEMSCFDKLMFLNKKLFVMVENSEGAHNSKLDAECLDKAEALINTAMGMFK